MTPRQRILDAIDHKATDALPVGFKATVDVFDRFKRQFGVDDLMGVLDALPVDTHGVFNNTMVGVFPRYVGGPKRVMYPNTYPDGTWDTFYGYKRKWIEGAAGRNEEVIMNPLAHATTMEEVEQYDWPQAEWFDYSTIKDQCDRAGDYAIVFLAGSLGQTSHLLGPGRIWLEMYDNPALVEACYARLTGFIVDFTDRTLTAAEGRIDIICVQDDVGMQTGPMIGPDMYRRFIKPYHKRIFEAAHRHGAKVMNHSCGAVTEFIPDFIEIGTDILDPVQTTAAGMDPARLKREFGKDICFHGGIDTQGVLAMGSPDDVCRQIDRLVEDFGATEGGFIMAPAHYLQADAPWENVMAVFDHLRKWR